ncbi:hypothetical protein Tco_1113504 [Tanacetum coccineum]|uniref:Uncharacterized protein n=1 Tax=Tanacetum coccineum TaxID=301880 RepID=A0ABQ5ISY7_9ASTR
MKIEESLNVTFNETPPPSKTSPLVDDELDEEEAIKITKKKLSDDIEGLKLYKDYDEEREMEPRPRPTRETTLPLWSRSPGVRRQRERVVGFKEASNREGSRAG